jgi:polysaccharide pyruvyl transferase WcaK-like protein
MRNLKAGLQIRQCHILGSLPHSKRLEDADAWRREFEAADAVLINGEGTLHHDRPYALYLLGLGQQAVAMDKQVYLVNSTWESNSPATVALLKGFSGVWVRDSASAAELAVEGVAAEIVPDLTFMSNYPTAMAAGLQVLVTDSVYADTSRDLQRLVSSPDWRYLPIIQWPALGGARAAVGKWLRAMLYRGLMASSLGFYKPRQYYIDLGHCETNTGRYLQSLATARTVVSGRYHAVCLCLQHRLPFVCLTSNTRKVQNLLDDVGIDLAHHMLTIEQLRSLSKPTLLMHADYSEMERQRLDVFLIQARERIAGMLDAVSLK